jgi:hypothetical protein
MNGMSSFTTRNEDELVDQLIYEFAKKCNYVLNKNLERQLQQPAKEAAGICRAMKVDPGTYVDAHVTYAPVIRGYGALTPQQLCCRESRRYVTDFIAMTGKRNVAHEFETECAILAKCMESGWKEQLALYNPTLDFSPWFRILMCSVKDDEIITKYGYSAAQILHNDKELVEYLKTVKSSDGVGLDFSRIPNFSL